MDLQLNACWCDFWGGTPATNSNILLDRVRLQPLRVIYDKKLPSFGPYTIRNMWFPRASWQKSSDKNTGRQIQVKTTEISAFPCISFGKSLPFHSSLFPYQNFDDGTLRKLDDPEKRMDLKKEVATVRLTDSSYPFSTHSRNHGTGQPSSSRDDHPKLAKNGGMVIPVC